MVSIPFRREGVSERYYESHLTLQKVHPNRGFYFLLPERRFRTSDSIAAFRCNVNVSISFRWAGVSVPLPVGKDRQILTRL